MDPTKPSFTEALWQIRVLYTTCEAIAATTYIPATLASEEQTDRTSWAMWKRFFPHDCNNLVYPRPSVRGRRWGTPAAPWTSQFITGLTYRDEQPFTLTFTFTPTGNLESPINLHVYTWTVGMKPEKTHADAGRTCKLRTETSQLGFNPARTTAPPCPARVKIFNKHYTPHMMWKRKQKLTKWDNLAKFTCLANRPQTNKWCKF